MEHYGEVKTITISSIPEDLIARYDYIAKRLAGSRSLLVRLQMENLIKNCQAFFAKEATTQQLAQWANNDVFRFFGMKTKKDEKSKIDLTNQAV